MVLDHEPLFDATSEGISVQRFVSRGHPKLGRVTIDMPRRFVDCVRSMTPNPAFNWTPRRG
jgi:hypothetical protein